MTQDSAVNNTIVRAYNRIPIWLSDIEGKEKLLRQSAAFTTQ